MRRWWGPYMDVSLETEQWQTSVVYHSTSPEWNEKHDFLAAWSQAVLTDSRAFHISRRSTYRGLIDLIDACWSCATPHLHTFATFATRPEYALWCDLPKPSLFCRSSTSAKRLESGCATASRCFYAMSLAIKLASLRALGWEVGGRWQKASYQPMSEIQPFTVETWSTAEQVLNLFLSLGHCSCAAHSCGRPCRLFLIGLPTQYHTPTTVKFEHIPHSYKAIPKWSDWTGSQPGLCQITRIQNFS